MPVGYIFAAVVVWSTVSIWAGIDATDRSSHSALLWALTVFFGVIPGLLLYLNLGRDVGPEAGAASVQRSELITCPNCHAREASDRKRCRFCDESLHEL